MNETIAITVVIAIALGALIVAHRLFFPEMPPAVTPAPFLVSGSPPTAPEPQYGKIIEA